MSENVTGKRFLDVEDLEVYQLLCQLHIDVCDLSHKWPAEETYELGSQVRRSSNSSPAQLAEKHDDRHVRNKIEGVNRSRGEAGETIHHLHIAKLKRYIAQDTYRSYRERYKQCIRMLNGLERSLERQLPAHERRWIVAEGHTSYGETDAVTESGWPIPDPETDESRIPNTEHRTLNTEHRTLNP